MSAYHYKSKLALSLRKHTAPGNYRKWSRVPSHSFSTVVIFLKVSNYPKSWGRPGRMGAGFSVSGLNEPRNGP
jgi:hypothetical protein